MEMDRHQVVLAGPLASLAPRALGIEETVAAAPLEDSLARLKPSLWKTFNLLMLPMLLGVLLTLLTQLKTLLALEVWAVD